jgi:hypothetical protein
LQRRGDICGGDVSGRPNCDALPVSESLHGMIGLSQVAHIGP